MLINTKMDVPAEPRNLVPRTRLLGRLEAGLERKLTLLSAPAGYGKTTLLRQWICPQRQRGLPVAWISLDQGDDSPARFWEYIFAGLDATPASPFRAAAVPRQPAGGEALIELVNQLGQDQSGQLLIVLDGFEAITCPEILTGLDFLLARLPSNVHLVLAGRSDPGLKLAQLRARDQVVELRAADLAFSFEEAAAFLNQIKALDLAGQDLEALVSRTEGWVAALQLAALALSASSPQGRSGLIRDFSGARGYVRDYLAEEVLHQQPPGRQAFLLQTCILDRFSESLCRAVTNAEPGDASLAELQAANLFLVPVDEGRGWFRYHHLWAEFLRDVLYRTFPNLVPVLHRRAVGWLESQGYLEEAVQHALEVKDRDLVAHLVVQLRQVYGSQSHVNTLLKLMRALPPDYVPSRPNLCLGYAWSYAVSGNFDQAGALAALVEDYLHRSREPRDENPSRQGGETSETAAPYQREWHDPLGELQADLDLLRAFTARFSPEVAAAIRHGQAALERLPPRRLAQRGIALLFIGHAQLLLGDDAAARHNLTAAMTANEVGGGCSAYLSALNYLTQLLVLHGRLEEALSLNRRALDFVRRQPFELLAGIERIGLGDLLRQCGRLADAEVHLDEGIALAERGGDFVFRRDGYLARARLCLAKGDLPGAFQAVRQAERLVQRGRPAWDTALVSAWKARLLLAQGDLAAAEQWAQEYRPQVEDLVPYVKDLVCLTLARLRLAQGCPARARRRLEGLLASSEAAGRTGRIIEALVLQALALQALDDLPQALAKLDRALALAGPQGYARVFLDEGPAMARLLRALSARRPTVPRAYLDGLLAAFGPADSSTKRKSNLARSPLDPTTALSERELQVLKLIAAGKSYQQIADELVIALSTVQTHVKNVYSKLNAHSGLQAVARARELSLLNSSKTHSVAT